MMLVKTFLANSDVHGIGLFAAEPIASGTKIWEFMEGLDVVVDAALLTSTKEPVQSFIARYSYPHHTLPDKIIIDGDHGRFMNHSKTPNTDFKNISQMQGHATRDIAVGEEITCDYDDFAPGFVLD